MSPIARTLTLHNKVQGQETRVIWELVIMKIVKLTPDPQNQNLPFLQDSQVIQMSIKWDLKEKYRPKSAGRVLSITMYFRLEQMYCNHQSYMFSLEMKLREMLMSSTL